MTRATVDARTGPVWREKGRAWFRELARTNPREAWEFGDALVLGEGVRDFFGEEPPWGGRADFRRHFLDGADEARVMWEVMS